MENNKGNKHASIILINKESCSNPDGYISGVDDLDKETAINSCQAQHSDRNLDNSCHTTVNSLDVVECDINITLDFPTAYQHANGVFVKSSNTKMDDHIEFVSQNTINPHTTAKSSHISQDESRKNDVTSVPKMVTKRETYSASIEYQYSNKLCCKMSIVFAICCIIGCCLIPVILFYASQATDRDYAVTDPEYSHEKNISSATVSSYVAN